MVRGAVQTMGDGVKNQISKGEEDDEIPSTLETEEETEETTQNTEETSTQKETSTRKETSETAATTAASARNTNSSQTYTVRRGDTLVSISKRMYGTQKKWSRSKMQTASKTGIIFTRDRSQAIPNS